MGTTANGIPYPDSDDLVSQGAADMQAIAQALDSKVLAAGITFGPTGGDTNLYRYAANQLKTDGYFYSGNALYANHGAATQVGLVAHQGAYPGVLLGDTVLYRKSAENLEATGSLWSGAAGALISGGGTVYFGAALDVSLARDPTGGIGITSSSHLRAVADVVARSGADIQVSIGHWSGVAGIAFGLNADATLYRPSAGVLATSSDFQVMRDTGVPNYCGLGLRFNGVGAGAVSCGPPDSAGAGWRVLRVPNTLAATLDIPEPQPGDTAEPR